MNTSIDSLDTPSLVVDIDIMERNLARAADYARQHGLALRPHVKTHKSPVVAARQIELGAVGLTCATPHEASVMAAVTNDILFAYPPVGGNRAQRLAQLPAEVQLTVALDSQRAIEEINAAATAAKRTVRVYVELDLGMHRVGAPNAQEAIVLAKSASGLSALDFAGITFYPGHIREGGADQDAHLKELTRSLDIALHEFASARVPVKAVSGGSTPTLWRTHEVHGVTEFRPGTYVYNDRTTAAIGACAWDDCALTVLATVISTAVPGQAVIDAGTKALGREPVRGTEGEGFGQLLEHPEVVVSRMSEEHGILDISQSDWQPTVGERIRVIPNHVCIVVHLNDVVYGVSGTAITTSWKISARGRADSRQPAI